MDSSEAVTQRSMERIIKGLGIVPVQSSFNHLLNSCVSERVLCGVQCAVCRGQPGSRWACVQRDGEDLCTGKYGSCPGNLGGHPHRPSTVPFLL